MENEQKRPNASEASNRIGIAMDDANEARIVPGDSADATLTSESVIENLKEQIENLRTENRDLLSYKECSQEIIRNLNSDVGHYRLLLIIKSNTIVKQKINHGKTIKLLDGTIKMCKTEITNKAAFIAKLHEEHAQYHKRLYDMEKKLLEKGIECLNATNEMAALKAKLKERDFINAELQKTIGKSQCIIAEYTERERIVLQKLQEAVAVRTAAWLDQVESSKQEVISNEDLAKCESPVAKITKSTEEEEKEEEEEEKSKVETNEQESAVSEQQQQQQQQQPKDYCDTLVDRCRLFERKYKEALKEIEKQTENLNQTANALAVMERKMIETESRMRDNKLAVQCAQDSEYEIHHYIIKNRQLQGKYKATIEQARRMYESEIVRLNRENAELKTEVRNLYMENNSLMGRF